MADTVSVPLTTWADAPGRERLYVYGTAVALRGQGVLIVGPSGAGKSQLALDLLIHGAELIADDGVTVDLSLQTGGQAFLERPGTATDLIESRGVGLLRAGSVCGRAPLTLVVDMGAREPERLPPGRFVTTGTADVPLILGSGHPSLAHAIVWMLRHGRQSP